MEIAADIQKVVEPIGERFCPALAEEVRHVEGVMGSSLPPSYFSFLTTIGNCMFSGFATVDSLSGEKLGLATMFGVSGPFKSILKDLESHPDYLAAGIIPISDTHFGDRYVLELGTGR